MADVLRVSSKVGEASCFKLDPTRGTPLVMAVGAVAVAQAAATGVGAPSAPAGKHLRSATVTNF